MQAAATVHPRLYFCVTLYFIKHCFHRGLCQPPPPQPTHNSIHRGLWLEMRHSSGFHAVWRGATDTRERGGNAKGGGVIIIFSFILFVLNQSWGIFRIALCCFRDMSIFNLYLHKETHPRGSWRMHRPRKSFPCIHPLLVSQCLS